MNAARAKLRMTAGPGDFEGRRRPQQQARTDGPAHGDHSHLAGAELVAKSLFIVAMAVPRASGTYTRNTFVPKTIFCL